MTSTLLLLSILLTTQTKLEPPKWIETTSKDKDFSFSMPAKPVERVVVQQLDDKPLNVLDYSCLHEGLLYKVERSKLPVEIPDGKLEKAIDASRDSVAAKVKILTDHVTTVAGWPAHELLVKASLKPGAEPSEIAMLIFFTNQDYYQVRVFAPRPGTHTKDVRKFFDSIKPVKGKTAAAKGE